jgi:hypothetical protein
MLVFISAFLWTPAWPAAKTDRWTNLMVLGKLRHEPAYFLKAVDLAQSFGANDPRLHVARQNAALHCESRNPALSEQLFKQDIADLENLDVDFPEIPFDCLELARMYELEGRHAEAESLLMRALGIRKKWHEISNEEPYNAQILAWLFVVYYGQQKEYKAEQVRHEMNEAMEKLGNEVTRARCLEEVSNLLKEYAQKGKQLSAAQSRALIETALKMSERAASLFQKNGQIGDYANQLRLSAEIYLALAEPERAQVSIKKSLALIDDKFAPGNDLAIRDTIILAEILYSAKRNQEAEQLQSGYLSKLAQQHGQLSTNYIEALNSFAGLWDSAGREDLAQAFKRKANQLSRMHIETSQDTARKPR